MLESPDDSILQSDLESLVNEKRAPFGIFDGKTVMVTGATGLIGSQIVKALECSNRLGGTKIKIIALARNAQKAEKVFSSLTGNDCFELLIQNILDPLDYEGDVDYIIHAASATSSRYFVERPVETINTALNGTKNVLDFAKTKNISGMVYLSSLEVYGVPDKTKNTVGEADFGYLDPLQVRSSYSEGKRMAECICASYASEYGVPVKAARLSQTFGAGVSYNDGRVFAEFARCAIEKKDIVLHTSGGTVRTYCYTSDAVAGILTILGSGSAGEAYNVSNKNTKISIRDMAQLVCDTFKESKIKVTFDTPSDIGSFGYNPEMVIALDSSKLEGLGWSAKIDLPEMFTRLVGSMKGKKEK